MKISIRTMTLTLLAALAVSACTWVKTEPGAERVQLRSAEHVRNCERIGQTTTSVRDRVAAVQRRPGKVEDELDDLARNSAVELGGDTIVADSPVRDGQRRYIVYHCGN
jgi:hypothetical protein